MSQIIFSQSAGFVSTFDDPAVPANVLFSLEPQTWQGYSGFKAIVTRVSFGGQGNYQLAHSIGGQVHLYVFGERVGQLTVAGIAFDDTCDVPASAGMPTGIENVLTYYNSNRLAERDTPLTITIGTNTVLLGYLSAIAADAHDARARMWQFALEFKLVPTEDDARENLANSQMSGSTTTEETLEGEVVVSTFPEIDTDTGVDGGGVSHVQNLTAAVVADGFAAPGTGARRTLVEALRL